MKVYVSYADRNDPVLRSEPMPVHVTQATLFEIQERVEYA
jgi:hypothetical protein